MLKDKSAVAPSHHPKEGPTNMSPANPVSTSSPDTRAVADSLGHPQTCVYPDVCLGIAHVSGNVTLSGQGVWQIHNVSALFALQIPWGEKGRYIVYLPDPLSRESDFTRYIGNP